MDCLGFEPGRSVPVMLHGLPRPRAVMKGTSEPGSSEADGSGVTALAEVLRFLYTHVILQGAVGTCSPLQFSVRIIKQKAGSWSLTEGRNAQGRLSRVR